MNTYESNILTTIKFFKNNIGKMLLFIIMVMLITGIFSHKYYKNNQSYTSTITIRFNDATGGEWTIIGVTLPYRDMLYFLENKEIKNITLRLRQGQNINPKIEIEVPQKSLDEKNYQMIKKLETILKEYNNKILTRLNNETNLKLEKFESQILKNKDSASVVSNLNTQIANLLTRKELFIERLKSNQLYIFDYDGPINIKKAKRLMVKNLLISFMISIILIILSLWVKLFLREINKNSK